MLVTKKRLYTELNKVMDIVLELTALGELEAQERKANIQELRRARAEDIDYLSKRIDRVYAGCQVLVKRIEALETKKTAKKKGKQNGKGSKKGI